MTAIAHRKMKAKLQMSPMTAKYDSSQSITRTPQMPACIPLALLPTLISLHHPPKQLLTHSSISYRTTCLPYVIMASLPLLPAALACAQGLTPRL